MMIKIRIEKINTYGFRFHTLLTRAVEDTARHWKDYPCNFE